LYAPAHTIEPLRFNEGPSYSDDVSPEFLRILPPEDRKPNPKTLLDITRDFEIPPTEAVYVGDSMIRDVYMARRAGVHAAWARYGTEYDRSLWDTLTNVTHWKYDDVQRESELRSAAGGVVPDVELKGFADLLEHFTFSAPTVGPRPSTN
jgi:phosphoglycolate phosphatase